ncbi:hypothetical protein TIFTF001_022330 [Ficus carica]|uniref:Pollen Ole e 1 allergen and extensin family protein n=1 Tax=Ficus carica TaxID=3494 RepID=A0AA88DJZ1_FICCA|nr:hypothetical protein TIFTF001_022330 [Ficus carica]
MANPPQLLLLGILLVATTTVANSLIILNGTEVAQLRILGTVTCDLPPPPPPPGSEPILGGINVGLACNGTTKSLAQALTDVNGFYELVFTTVDTVLFDPSQCYVFVRLPIGRCRIYPPTGTLRATLTVVSLLQPVFGAVGIILGGPLELVTS